MSVFSHFYRALTLTGSTQLLSWLGVLLLSLSMLVTTIASLSLQSFDHGAPTPRAEKGDFVLSVNAHREIPATGKQCTYTNEVLDGGTSPCSESPVVPALVSFWPSLQVVEPDSISSLPGSAEIYSSQLRDTLSPRAPPLS